MNSLANADSLTPIHVKPTNYVDTWPAYHKNSGDVSVSPSRCPQSASKSCALRGPYKDNDRSCAPSHEQLLNLKHHQITDMANHAPRAPHDLSDELSLTNTMWLTPFKVSLGKYRESFSCLSAKLDQHARSRSQLEICADNFKARIAELQDVLKYYPGTISVEAARGELDECKTKRRYQETMQEYLTKEMEINVLVEQLESHLFVLCSMLKRLSEDCNGALAKGVLEELEAEQKKLDGLRVQARSMSVLPSY